MAIWKRISDYPDYEVGDSGRIRSFKSGKPILLKQGGLSGGYYCVCLYRGSRESGKKFLVHRLVAEYFLEPPSEELVEECSKTQSGVVWVNHKDGIRINNEPHNLEWCTPCHNNTCTFESGRVVEKGSKNHLSLLREEDVIEMLRMYSSGTSEREVAKAFGVSRSTFASIRQGYSWNHVTGLPRKIQKPRGVKTKRISES